MRNGGRKNSLRERADIFWAGEETEGLRNTRARTARWSAARAG